MTVLAGAPPGPVTVAPPAAALARPARDVRALVETAAVAVALAWAALPLTAADGGRSPARVRDGLAVLLPALLLTRPWRRLPRVATGLGLWLGAAALAVAALSPAGWSGGDDAAAYGYAALASLTAAAWARTSGRRLALAAGVALGGLQQWGAAFPAWWGGGDPSREMIGSFGWHNPYAAYLAPAVLLAAALALWRVRPLAALGWVVAPLGVSGIVFSSSRATLALLTGGILVLAAVAMRARADGPQRGRRWPRPLARGAVLTAGCAAVTWLLAGPPLFAHRASPFAAAQQRAGAGETLAANGYYRVEFWREALASFRAHPLLGSGSHTLAAASELLVPGGWAHSNLAHDGLLQTLTDGGLVLGLPLAACCAAALWLALRCLVGAGRAGTVEPVRAAAAVAVLVALAHSALDFDWSHPSLLVQAAVLVALLVPATTERPSARPAVGRVVAGVTLLLLVADLGVSAAAARTLLGLRVTDVGVAQRADALRAAGEQPLAGPTPARRVLSLALTDVSGQPLRIPVADAGWAVRVTARLAAVDPALAVQRARVALHLGDVGPADAVLAAHLAAAAGHPGFAASLAALLGDLHRAPQARALLLPQLAQSLGHGAPTARDQADALLALDGGAPQELARCAEQAVGGVPAAPPSDQPDPGPPTDPAGCAALLRPWSSAGLARPGSRSTGG